MNSSRTLWKLSSIPVISLFVLVAATTRGSGEINQSGTSPNLVLWDTSSPVGDLLSADRSAWKKVPNDLLMLEADPPKASSDPGYYGREFSFKGDAVVETRTLTALFSSTKGRVSIYSKQNSSEKDSKSQSDGQPGSKLLDVFPVPAQDNSTESPLAISSCTLRSRRASAKL